MLLVEPPIPLVYHGKIEPSKVETLTSKKAKRMPTVSILGKPRKILLTKVITSVETPRT